jgi:hypothetical protein
MAKTVTVNGVELTEAQVREAWEELNRQPTAAEKHGIVRRLGDGGAYLLLDPAEVRAALDRAECHMGMVTLAANGFMGWDPVLSRANGVSEARIQFTVHVSRS